MNAASRFVRALDDSVARCAAKPSARLRCDCRGAASRRSPATRNCRSELMLRGVVGSEDGGDHLSRQRHRRTDPQRSACNSRIDCWRQVPTYCWLQQRARSGHDAGATLIPAVIPPLTGLSVLVTRPRRTGRCCSRITSVRWAVTRSYCRRSTSGRLSASSRRQLRTRGFRQRERCRAWRSPDLPIANHADRRHRQSDRCGARSSEPGRRHRA